MHIEQYVGDGVAREIVGMTLTNLPEPDQEVVARSSTIIKDLEQLVARDAVISDEEGRRAFEADALTAYRQMPLAVVLPQTTE